MNMPMPKMLPLDDEPGLFEERPTLPSAASVSPVSRKLAKSPTAYRTISEVAEELDVPQHVLRFWETKFTQLRPLKRGGGRRYYRVEDVTLIRQIHGLLYGQGYTIKGAQKVLKDKSPQPLQAVEPVQKIVDIVDNDEAEMVAPEKTRAVLLEMLAELRALRALV